MCGLISEITDHLFSVFDIDKLITELKPLCQKYDLLLVSHFFSVGDQTAYFIMELELCLYPVWITDVKRCYYLSTSTEVSQ